MRIKQADKAKSEYFSFQKFLHDFSSFSSFQRVAWRTHVGSKMIEKRNSHSIFSSFSSSSFAICHTILSIIFCMLLILYILFLAFGVVLISVWHTCIWHGSRCMLLSQQRPLAHIREGGTLYIDFFFLLHFVVAVMQANWFIFHFICIKATEQPFVNEKKKERMFRSLHNTYNMLCLSLEYHREENSFLF